MLRHPLSKRSTDQADMQAVDQAVDHTGSQRDGRAGDQVDSQADSRANLSEGRGGSRDRRSRGGVSDAVGYGEDSLLLQQQVIAAHCHHSKGVLGQTWVAAKPAKRLTLRCPPHLPTALSIDNNATVPFPQARTR